MSARLLSGLTSVQHYSRQHLRPLRANAGLGDVKWTLRRCYSIWDSNSVLVLSDVSDVTSSVRWRWWEG